LLTLLNSRSPRRSTTRALATAASGPADGGGELAQDGVGGEEGGVDDLLRGGLGHVDRALEEAGHVGPVELAQGVAGAAVLAEADGLERVEGAAGRRVAGEQGLAGRSASGGRCAGWRRR
jgi:hypothetical protein